MMNKFGKCSEGIMEAILGNNLNTYEAIGLLNCIINDLISLSGKGSELK